jgi:hypothetical protein
MPLGRDWNDPRYFFTPRSRMWGVVVMIIVGFLIYKMLS